jgi:lactoylglutathione lyase
MAYTKVDYVILYVADLARSIAFYRDVVGLPFKFQESGYAQFDTKGTTFALFDRTGLPGLLGRDAGSGGLQSEVAFLSADVEAEAERLKTLGVEVLSGPVDRPWGQRTLHVLDPDGHVVEFAQEIERSTPRRE